MLSFFTVLCHGSFAVGLVPKLPSNTLIHSVAHNMFKVADVNNDNEISMEEFTDWSAQHVDSAALLTAFKRVSRNSSRGVDRRKLKRVDDTTPTIDTSQAADRLQELKTRHEAHEAALQQMRRGGKQFNVEQLRALQDAFEDNAGATGHLTKEAFVTVLQARYPELTVGAASALFESFDADNSGDLDLQEFTLGITRSVAGSMTQKLELLFSVLDQDHSGEVGIGELLAVLRKEKHKASEWTTLTEEVPDDCVVCVVCVVHSASTTAVVTRLAFVRLFCACTHS